MAWHRATLSLALILPWAAAGRARAADPFDEGPYLKMYEFLPRAYNMSPEQTRQFHAVMDRIVEQYYEYLTARSDEVDPIRQEQLEIQELRRAGVAVPREQQRAVQRRRAAVIQASSLGVRNVMREIERFLPPEQVAAARGRRRIPPPTTAPVAVQPAQGPPAAEPTRTAPSRRSRSRLGFKPPEAWPRYVEAVIRRSELDAAGANEARRLLREAREQARQYRREHRVEYENVARIDDVKTRRELLDRLETPVGDLFDGMVQRLQQLSQENQSQQ
ncbi:MAG TPA: hypothetical protein VMZ31_01085 [Phycisphaerae bacterium]|nr:hypothetical protein [Phycisphaerae bacterium]